MRAGIGRQGLLAEHPRACGRPMWHVGRTVPCALTRSPRGHAHRFVSYLYLLVALTIVGAALAQHM